MKRTVLRGVLLVSLLLFSVWAAAAEAAEPPVAASPGDALRLALIGDTCPTFSWGAVAGAAAHELVVYRVGEAGQEAKAVLKQKIPGSASSWTPSLDRCLERGGRYAWTVRAVGEKEPAQWSAPSLFQVASGPSEAEFDEAVDVVRKYLAGQYGVPYATQARTEAGAKASASRSAATAAPPSPLAPPATTVMNADGNIHATSFSGDGSNLVGVAASIDFCGLWREVSMHPLPGSCPGKTVFTTSTTYSGNLGGLAGADAKCNERATAAGLPGSYKAWLADQYCGPADDCRGFAHSVEPYYRTDGALIARDWDDLVDSSIANPINHDELGQLLVGSPYGTWTNTHPDGTPWNTLGNETCVDNTSDSLHFHAQGGHWNSVNSVWSTNGLYLDCDNQERLYCFQQ